MKRAYIKHVYSGRKVNLKKSRAQLLRYHGKAGRIQAWRDDSANAPKTLPQPTTSTEHNSLESPVTLQSSSDDGKKYKAVNSRNGNVYKTYERRNLKSTTSEDVIHNEETKTDEPEKYIRNNELNDTIKENCSYDPLSIKEESDDEYSLGFEETTKITDNNQRSDDDIQTKGNISSTNPKSISEHYDWLQKGNKQHSLTTFTRSFIYADAIITLEPFHVLSEEESKEIQHALISKADKTIFDSNNNIPPPTFRGQSFFSDGILKLWCGDNYTYEWLQKAVEELPSPRDGAKLVVKTQLDFPSWLSGAVFVPDYTDANIEVLMRRLHNTNVKWLDVKSWRLRRTEKQDDGTGLFLLLEIPQKEVDALMRRDCRLSYKLGEIYVKFRRLET